MPYLAIAFLTLLRGAHCPAQARSATRCRPTTRSSARPEASEVWRSARNPYRWSFDRQTGDTTDRGRGRELAATRRSTVRLPPPQSAARTSAGTASPARPPCQSGCTPSRLLPAFVPVPERPGRGDRRLRGARSGTAVVRRASTCSADFDSGDDRRARRRGRAAPVDTRAHVARPFPSRGFGEDGVGHLYVASLPAWSCGSARAVRHAHEQEHRRRSAQPGRDRPPHPERRR